MKYKSLITSLVALSSFLIFSQNAYATSYINVSSGSGGTVSLGSIKPSSTGVSASGSDTLTITTNCSAGYSVYVSGQEGKGTSLTNPSASANNTIFASETTVGSTATTLNSNTWGITGDSNNASASKYVGLPSYANATNKALISNSSADASGDNANTIYYGVKVDTSLTPGTYSGDVLYTTIVDSSCQTYTVIFNKNASDATGEMNNQTITTNITTALTENTFERSGYTFLGWATDAKGKTGTATDGIGTEADVDYTDEEEVTNLTTSGKEITLYAIWKKSAISFADVGIIAGSNIQDFDNSKCEDVTIGQITTLVDTRDTTTYTIKKLQDGRCWMIDNLTLGSKGIAKMTPDDTHITDGNIYYLPAAGTYGSLTDGVSKGAPTFTDDSIETSGNAQVQYKAADTTDNNTSNPVPENTGYYNFYAATLGYSHYYASGTGYGISQGSSPQDICPKGWKMPWASDEGTIYQGDAEFYKLALSYNDDSSVWSRYITPGATSTFSPTSSNPDVRTGMIDGDKNDTKHGYAGFSYAGSYGTDTVYGVGVQGDYWASSVSSAGHSRRLTFNTTVFPQYNWLNYSGFPIRCIAEEPKNLTINYNANGAVGSPSKSSDATTLDGEAIQLPSRNTMAKANHQFLGWALTSDTTEATYTAGQAISLMDLIAAAGRAGQSTSSGSTLTLYAVWKSIPDDGNLGTMQNFVCNNLGSGHTATLTDSRDNQTYTVYRIPTDQTYAGTSTVANVAGKCIMTKDLNLGAVASVSGASSSITANGTMTLSPNDSGFTTPTGSGESITVPTSNVTVSSPSSWSGTDNYSNKQYKANGTGGYAGRGYYSWGAAMVACPRGWRLPTSDEYNNNDSYDSSTGGLSAVIKGASAAATISNITDFPYTFIISGGYDGNFLGATAYGYYWTSTQGSSTTAHSLYMRTSDGLFRGNYSKYIGRSVRCIANETMQNVKVSELPTSATTTLIDSRDEQKYTVYRWPSTGTAGTDYQTGMSGYAIMTQDLALGYITGGSITKGSNLILSTDTSVGSTTSDTPIYVRTGTSDWDTGNSDDNLQYINGPSTTGHANSTHPYYSFGAAQKVCPKGWSLPTREQYVSIQTFMGGDNATGYSNLLASPYNFITSGGFNNLGWRYVNSDGHYWSSEQSSDAEAYNIFYRASSLLWVYALNKSNGFPVRCVAAP